MNVPTPEAPAARRSRLRGGRLWGCFVDHWSPSCAATHSMKLA